MYTRVTEVGTMTTASGSVVIGPIDISHFDRFSIHYKNNCSSALLDLDVELALDPVGTASTLDFVSASTAIIAAPSALAGGGNFITSAVNNAYHWLRIKAHVSATAAALPQLIATVGGLRARR